MVAKKVTIPLAPEEPVRISGGSGGTTVGADLASSGASDLSMWHHSIMYYPTVPSSFRVPKTVVNLKELNELGNEGWEVCGEDEKHWLLKREKYQWKKRN